MLGLKTRPFATCAFAFFLLAPAAEMRAQAQTGEFFGTFPSDPDGVLITTAGRTQFKLNKLFDFHDPNGLKWPVPAGQTVDGASIPQFFWTFIGGPFDGHYLHASIVHDYYCRRQTRTAHDTHRNFYYGMRAKGVGISKAKAMYWAVRAYGPDWILQRSLGVSICQQFNCQSGGGFPSVTVALTNIPGVDFTDSAVADIALQKFSAIAKTLETSNGDFLDIGTAGPIASDLDAIDASAALTREAFAENLHLLRPSALGIVDKTVSVQNLPKPDQRWAGDALPQISGQAVAGPTDATILDAGNWAAPIADAITLGNDGAWSLGTRPSYIGTDNWTELTTSLSAQTRLDQIDLQRVIETTVRDLDATTLDLDMLRDGLLQGNVPLDMQR